RRADSRRSRVPASARSGVMPAAGRSALAVVLLMLTGCLGATTSSPAPVNQTTQGSWASLATMPTARQEVAVAALRGHVWVIGGFGSTGEPTATAESYDPASNAWTARAPLPVVIHHAAAVTVGERLFVLGGYTGGRVSWEPSDDLWEWNEPRGAWEPRPPMPTPRGALAAAVLNGRIHALGGSQRDALNVHEVYDPATNAWKRANVMPTPRDHLAAVAFRGQLWALGGRTSFLGTQYANVEIYDAAADAWHT